MAEAPLRLTALELASGAVLGLAAGRAKESAGLSTPLAELEASVLPGLLRPPCVVSFSGGMDSSFVLAVATRVARREGLPEPIAVTWRFTGAPKAEESRWQERVIAALDLHSWQLLQAGDDLDIVGPVADRLLSRHGVLHPFNLHLHLPIVELAVGGSLLTGVGGDQILSGWRQRPLSVGQRVRGHVPGRAVARLRRQQGTDGTPWLQARAARAVFRRHRQELRAQPRALDQRISWHARRRDLLMTCASLTTIAGDHDVHVVNPLVDPRFLSALSVTAGSSTALNREELLRTIADGKLPPEAIALRPKARFLEVFLRDQTREFVRSWDGTGVDSEFVDPEALREVWSRWPIPGRTAGIVQQLWLASNHAGAGAQREATP